MKVYIAGKISGLDYPKVLAKFTEKEKKLSALGWRIMNPTCLPSEGFSHADYLHVCFAMIDVCDAVYFMKDWKESDGACQERSYAKANHKKIIYEEDSGEGVRAE